MPERAPSPAPACAGPDRGGPPAPRGARHARRALGWGGSVLALAAAALVAAALLPGSHSTADGVARRSVAHPTAAPGAGPRHEQRRVVDSRIGAARYGAQVAQTENGIGADGLPVSDLPPIAVARLRRPIARFREYAEDWAGRLAVASGTLVAALRAGDRPRARSAWAGAFSAYLHLGATYDLLPAGLERRIAEIPPSTATRRFAGLHRIERGLWTGAAPRSLVATAVALRRAVGELRRRLPGLAITPADYVRRAHEILEDAQRDLMSGAEVPWSHAGVLGTAAALAATDELVGTLAPAMVGRSDTLAQSRWWLHRLAGALGAVRRPDGDEPPLDRLSLRGRERIDAALAGALGALEQIPDTLETHLPRPIPTIAATR